MTDPVVTSAPKGANGQKAAMPRGRARVSLRAKSKFWRDEAGAVTVDWLALSLAIAGMVVAFIAYFTPLLQAAAAAIFL